MEHGIALVWACLFSKVTGLGYVWSSLLVELNVLREHRVLHNSTGNGLHLGMG